jgi:hypothetical protein
MFQHIHLHLHERAAIVRNGQVVRALGPGSHAFWRRHDVTRWDTNALTFAAPAAMLAVLPGEWYEVIQLDAHQRAVAHRNVARCGGARLRGATLDPGTGTSTRSRTREALAIVES